MKIIKYIIKNFRCCLERIKFYFVKSYCSYTSVAAEGGQLYEAKSKLNAGTKVRKHPDHLHWTPSILWQTDRQLFTTVWYVWHLECASLLCLLLGCQTMIYRQLSKPSHFAFVYFPLHSCFKQIKNKLMTPTFNKEFLFFLIAWVLNSDNFTKSVVIQKWYKQLRALKHRLRTTPHEFKKNCIAIFIQAQDNSTLQFWHL